MKVINYYNANYPMDAEKYIAKAYGSEKFSDELKELLIKSFNRWYNECPREKLSDEFKSKVNSIFHNNIDFARFCVNSGACAVDLILFYECVDFIEPKNDNDLLTNYFVAAMKFDEIIESSGSVLVSNANSDRLYLRRTPEFKKLFECLSKVIGFINKEDLSLFTTLFV